MTALRHHQLKRPFKEGIGETFLRYFLDAVPVENKQRHRLLFRRCVRHHIARESSGTVCDLKGNLMRFFCAEIGGSTKYFTSHKGAPFFMCARKLESCERDVNRRRHHNILANLDLRFKKNAGSKL